MKKTIFFVLLSALLFASCTNQNKLRIQVLDENNQPIPEAEIEFLNLNYRTDAKGFCEIPHKLKCLEYITVKKYGYTDLSTLMKFDSEGKTSIIHLESAHNYLNSLRKAQMQRLLRQLKSFDPKDKSAKMVALGTWDAQFPGGANELSMYINENIAYPYDAIDNNEQGKVIVSFIVEAGGALSNIRIDKGLSKSLNAESMRIIRSMPRWIPAYSNGIPVRTRCRLPIVYTLE